MNTNLVVVYYNWGKLNLFRIHIDVTLCTLKDQLDQINDHLKRDGIIGVDNV